MRAELIEHFANRIVRMFPAIDKKDARKITELIASMIHTSLNERPSK